MVRVHAKTDSALPSFPLPNMVGLLAQSALAAAVLLSGVNAVMIPNDAIPSTVKDLLGFDPNLIKDFSIQDLQDDTLPEIIYLDDDDVSFASTERNATTQLEASVPSDDDLEQLRKRFIVGVDDRQVWNQAAYPYFNVGRLVWSNGVFCSGALVGPRHLLTAKHCLISGATGTFTPGYDNGARYGSGRVTLAVTTGAQTPGSPCETKGDWAVMILDSRPGDQLGYFGVKLPDAGKLDRPILTHVGYPGDRDGGNRPYRQTSISAHSRKSFDCDATGPFYSNADTAGGQSGGPQWEFEGDAPYIWGTLSISVSSPEWTYAGWASGNQLLQTVSRLRTEYA